MFTPKSLAAARGQAPSAHLSIGGDLPPDQTSGQLSALMTLRRYLTTLSTGRVILWCYFIWYAVVLVRYVDSSLRLWLTSIGLCVLIGVALYMSTAASVTTRVKLDRLQTFRLFLMPFCVSSFAALVKGRDFVLIFSPRPEENFLAAGICAALCALVFLLKKLSRR